MPSNRAIEQRNRVIGLLLMPIAFFALVSLTTYSVNDYPNSSLRPDEVLNAGGRVGAVLASALFLVCGYGAYGMPIIVAFWGWNRLCNGNPWQLVGSLAICLSVIIAGVTTVSLITTMSADLRFECGGALGFRLGQLTRQALGVDAAFLLSSTVFAGSVVLPVLWVIRRRHIRRRLPSRVSDDLDEYDTRSVSRSSLV